MLRLAWSLVAFVATFILTGAIRNRAANIGLMDVPNHRSSHAIPMPRGGGLSFVVVMLVSVGLAMWFWPEERRTWVALLGSMAVGAIGYADDRWRLSARSRLIVHFAAACWAVFWLGGLYSFRVGSITIPLGWFGSVLAVVAIVWFINLYNFMDGIDGLAAGEATVVGLFGGTLLLLSGDKPLGWFLLVLAAATAGFLTWNWAPARIFMGDVGSGVLGYLFGTVAIASETRASVPAVLWILLLSLFVVDATATLVVRVLHGEKLSEAHRTHAYQLAIQMGYSHRKVASTFLIGTAMIGSSALVAVRYPVLQIPVLILFLAVECFVWTAVRRRPERSDKTRCAAGGGMDTSP